MYLKQIETQNFASLQIYILFLFKRTIHQSYRSESFRLQHQDCVTSQVQS